jgi:hypothetical protein
MATHTAPIRILNPVAPLGRTWRRLRRRPRSMQVRTALIIIAVVVGLVTWLVLAPAGMPGSTGIAGASEVPVAAAFKPTPVSQASTSSRGVSAKSINVVFPVVSLNSLAGKFGFAQDQEFGDQSKAIHLFVNQINKAGGIHGRDINPIIVNFDPTDESGMRALCKQWTEGSPAAFAVIDGIGDWTGDNELCVTQEGHTPMIASLDHHHRLDPAGFALSVVDRSGRCPRAQCHGELGRQLGPPESEQEGRVLWSPIRPAIRLP